MGLKSCGASGVASLLIFQQDDGEGGRAAVGERQRRAADAEGVGVLGGATVEDEGGRGAGDADDLDLQPAHAAADACA